MTAIRLIGNSKKTLGWVSKIMTVSCCFSTLFLARQRVVTAFSTTTSARISSRRSFRSPTSLFSSTTATTVNGRIPVETKEGSDLITTALDVRTIVKDIPMIVSHLTSRRASQDTIDSVQQLSSLQAQRVQLIQERDESLNQRKEASAAVGKLMMQLNQNKKDSDATASLQQQVDAQKETSAKAASAASQAEEALADIQSTMDDLMAGLPNLLDNRVPDGNDEADNEVVLEWGDIEALPKQLKWNDEFEPQWHDDVALALQGYESEAAVQMSGARFVALSGRIAQLERAIAMFLVDLHTTKHGYTEVSVPYIVGRSALEGTSQLPKFQDDLFAITPESHTCNGEDAFLIPTAEVPVTNLHANSILEAKDLPLSYVAYTPCFRAEAGSYGRDTKGLIRTHQFQKVELVKITTPDTSNDEHEALTKHAEACLQALELPYRKVRLCSGDIGFAARHCYDLEVWLPGAKEYREISSCSNTGDFQARRMALRYRPVAQNEQTEDGPKKKKKAKKPKPEFCHTINGSGLAVGRTLVAVLENYQCPDGSVTVPTVLRPYMGGLETIEVPSKK